MHARRNPVDHRWVFPFYFYAIDLDELTELDRKVAGFGFNRWRPICLRTDGSPICIVAEVNNSFKERHLYVLKGGEEFPLRCHHEKQFHVSPFNSMDGYYEFTFSEPGNDLNIEIRFIRNDTVIMDAALWGVGKPLNTGNLWRTILRQPFTAGLTMPRIVWQAAVLHYKRKLPVFHKPAPRSSMTVKENT
jgi:cyclopropane-fatty-acyl-phospholipid synthase